MRKSGKVLVTLSLFCALGVFVINQAVNRRGRPLIREASAAPPALAALVFGAYAYPNGTPCMALEDRLLTGLSLYQNGRVKKLILSGDHGREDYDEVNAMRRYLEAAGVPKEDLFCDHAGFDTYDSLYRARDVFGADELLLVTQEFHLPRALYIADSLGLRCEGVVADRRPLAAAGSLQVREVGAKVKAFWDVYTQRFPVYLGESVTLAGSALVTHDS